MDFMLVRLKDRMSGTTQCLVCYKEYASYYYAKNHYKTRHMQRCGSTSCSKEEFGSVSEAAEHFAEVHLGAANCYICGKSYDSAREARIHKAMKHLKACEICGKRFPEYRAAEAQTCCKPVDQ